MYKKELNRTYRYTDAALIQLADSLISTAQRDLTALAAYGVTASTITDIKAVRDTFSNTETDEELSGGMIEATYNKDQKREEILELIRQIANRARIHYGEESAAFRRFGAYSLTQNTDAELCRTARIVVLVATEYLAPLAAVGLTIELVNELETAIADFNTLLDLKQLAVSDRDLAVEDRIEKGNALFHKMKEISAKGKLCWAATHEAKHSHYVLYQGKKGASVTAANVAPLGRVTASITGIRKTSTLNITNTGEVGMYVYFAWDPTATYKEDAAYIEGGDTFAVKAHALGFDVKTGTRHLIFANPNELKGSYSIEWGG